MKERELLQLKAKIQEAKNSTLRLEGQKDNLFKQLKKEFDCTTIEEAETLLEKEQKKEKKLDVKITDGLEKLENKL